MSNLRTYHEEIEKKIVNVKIAHISDVCYETKNIVKFRLLTQTIFLFLIQTVLSYTTYPGT